MLQRCSTVRLSCVRQNMTFEMPSAIEGMRDHALQQVEELGRAAEAYLLANGLLLVNLFTTSYMKKVNLVLLGNYNFWF